MSRNLDVSVEWENVRVGIAASRWNSAITDEMLQGAIAALKNKGVKEENILTVRCPGSYEIPLVCQQLLEDAGVEGVVAIGAVIRGETPHFDYVCDAVNRGVAELNLKFSKPVTFGVLTTDSVEQAVERSRQDKGNKGAEAALALCEMIGISKGLKAGK